jgi:hypothetical protein
MSDYKKLMEEVALSHFLKAYRLATGEEFVDVEPSETPDFLARDSLGCTVGIELTQVKFPPSDMSWHRIMGEEWANDLDAFWRIVELLHVKEQKLPRWPACERRLLVVQLGDIPLADLGAGIATDPPTEHGFTEVWLADFTMLDMFGGCDVHPIVHEHLSGPFKVASTDRKPYG